jgi:hypothetical protein
MNIDKNLISNLNLAFEDLDFNYQVNNTSQLILKPSEYRGNMNKIYINYFSDSGKILPIQSDQWTLDISKTGVNKTTNTGGLIDGVTIEDSHSYLVWVFLDTNMQFNGYGLSRWEKSDYTGVSSGTKGLEATFTGLTNAYQFCIGSKVRIASTSTDWNYGTITSIVSNTSIKVLCDNESGYGTNLTTATGTIKQFTMHRPYSINSTSQTLYSDYYRLIGWCDLGLDESSTGGVDLTNSIVRFSKWTRKRQFVNPSETLFYDQTLSASLTGANGNVNIGKYVSPLSKYIYGVGLANSASSSTILSVVDIINNTPIQKWQVVVSASSYFQNNYTLPNNSDYNVRIQNSFISGTCRLRLNISGYIEED